MYSVAVSKAQIDNFCVRCERKFQRWEDYHAHVTDVRCALKIKPIRTTARRTGVYGPGGTAVLDTVVGDWELKNKGAIIQ